MSEPFFVHPQVIESAHGLSSLFPRKLLDYARPLTPDSCHCAVLIESSACINLITVTEKKGHDTNQPLWPS